MTVTFTPSAGGMQTATLTVTDAVLNSGTATANGVGLALIPQTVTITSPASGPVVYGVAPITVTATSNSASGIPVVLSIDNSSTAGAGTLSGTASGSMLTINGVGTIIIDANQAGNSTYAQATEAQITITVTQAPQAITFAPTSPIMFTTTPIALAATGGGSGNPVTFTVTSGSGAITGTAAAPTLTLSNIGTVVVAANEAGSANYLAAPTVTKSIVVNVIGQVAEPSFSIASGTYYGSANKVTLSTATAGAPSTTPLAAPARRQQPAQPSTPALFRYPRPGIPTSLRPWPSNSGTPTARWQQPSTSSARACLTLRFRWALRRSL